MLPSEGAEEDISILQFREGVPEAFKVLYIGYYPEFLSFSNMLLQDIPAAKKAVTGAFFLLWDRHADFDSVKRIKAFLYLAVRNNSLRHLQHPESPPPAARPFFETYNSSLPGDILQDILLYTEKAGG